MNSIVGHRSRHVALARDGVGRNQGIIRHKSDIDRISRRIALGIRPGMIGCFTRCVVKPAVNSELFFDGRLHFCTLGSVVVLDFLPFMVNIVKVCLICGGPITGGSLGCPIAVRRSHFLFDAGKAGLRFRSYMLYIRVCAAIRAIFIE